MKMLLLVWILPTNRCITTINHLLESGIPKSNTYILHARIFYFNMMDKFLKMIIYFCFWKKNEYIHVL